MGKLLIVDDQSEFLDTLKASMEDAGFDVVTASSGYEALSLVRRFNDIDCILTDYFMPEMRGDELATTIKHVTDIPVVIMTGDPDISFEKIYRSGISGIMNKPINAANFIEFLRTNELHIGRDLSNHRKFLRQTSINQLISIDISNGRQTLSGQLSNLSAGGLGVVVDGFMEPFTTVKFSLQYDGEELIGFMHCRWKASYDDHLKAGFEFDSTTKQAFSRSDIFRKLMALG